MVGQGWADLRHVQVGGHPGYCTKPDVELSPGAHACVTVNEVQLGEAGNVMAMPDADVTPAVPLRVARKAIGGGWDGFITDPMTGDRLAVSLARWRGRDQDATLLQTKIEIAGATCPVGDLSQRRALPDAPAGRQTGTVALTDCHPRSGSRQHSGSFRQHTAMSHPRIARGAAAQSPTDASAPSGPELIAATPMHHPAPASGRVT
jgi:hypothetical protein